MCLILQNFYLPAEGCEAATCAGVDIVRVCVALGKFRDAGGKFSSVIDKRCANLRKFSSFCAAEQPRTIEET